MTQTPDPLAPPAGTRRFETHPRLHWPKEVGDFTPWLAANIDLLAACLGEPLTLAGREAPLGEEGFRADLLAHDAAGGLVVIEAQMGRTNARHLGQLFTYAATDAISLLVWVIADMNVEGPMRTGHARALAWLNAGLAGTGVRFVAVEASVESDWHPEGTDRAEAELRPRFASSICSAPGSAPADGQLNRRWSSGARTPADKIGRASAVVHARLSGISAVCYV